MAQVEHNLVDKDKYRAMWRTKNAQDRFEFCLREIAKNPILDNETINKYFNGDAGKQAAEARRVLGLTLQGKSPVHIDRAIYEPMCASLGVTPVKGESINKPNTKKYQRKERDLPKPIEGAPKPLEPQPTFIPPVGADVKTLVSMLKDELAKNNIEEIIITPNFAKIRRVIEEEV